MAFEIKRNDRRPFFVVALTDNDGVVDLTTAGTAFFNMATALATGAPGGPNTITRGAATITDAKNGEVTYSWGTADTRNSGKFLAEVAIIWADGKQETYPGGPATGSYWPITITDDIDAV